MKNIQLVLLLLLAHSFLLRNRISKRTINSSRRTNTENGLRRHKGKLVIEARFDAASLLRGLARVGVVDEELPEIDGRPNILWATLMKRATLLSPCVTTRWVVSPKTGGICRNRSGVEGRFSICAPRVEQLSVGYVDRDGRVVIPSQFFAAGDFQRLAAVDVAGERDSSCDRAHLFGYIDKTGTVVSNRALLTRQHL